MLARPFLAISGPYRTLFGAAIAGRLTNQFSRSAGDSRKSTTWSGLSRLLAFRKCCVRWILHHHPMPPRCSIADSPGALSKRHGEQNAHRQVAAANRNRTSIAWRVLTQAYQGSKLENPDETLWPGNAGPQTRADGHDVAIGHATSIGTAQTLCQRPLTKQVRRGAFQLRALLSHISSELGCDCGGRASRTPGPNRGGPPLTTHLKTAAPPAMQRVVPALVG
jgi:hypothetical protein